MQIPLVITAASTGEGMKRYIESARILKGQAEFLFIEFQPQNPDELEGKRWMIDFPNARRIIFQNKQYPGNIWRFMYMKDVLKRFGYTKDSGRWVLFTDTDDVIFQKGFPVLDQGKQIYVSNEGITFSKAKFWAPIIKKYLSMRSLAELPVYNTGTFLMRMRYVEDLLNYIDEKKDKIKLGCADQLHYNMWLSMQPKSVIAEHPSLVTALYNNLKAGNVRKEGNQFINSAGDPYMIVHANGNQKKML